MASTERYFHVQVQGDAERARLVASGELDAATADQLEAALADAGKAAVELDLAAVSFVDSSGLRVITAALRRAEEEGRSFSVSSVSEAVRRVFEMTGLGSLVS